MWPSVFALYPYCCATCGQAYLHCTPTVVRHVAKCICTVPLLLCDMWPSVFALYPYCCATCGQAYLHCTPTVVQHVAKCICTVPLLLCDMWPSVFALYPYCCATCGQVYLHYPYCCATCGQVYLHCTPTVVRHVAKCICIVVQPRSVVNCPVVCPTTSLQLPSWSGGKAISLRNGGLWDSNPGWVIPVTEQTGVLVPTLPDVFLGQL